MPETQAGLRPVCLATPVRYVMKQDTRSVLDCSLRSLRIALGSHFARRRNSYNFAWLAAGGIRLLAHSTRQRRAILVAADCAGKPPTSSSLADEKRVSSFRYICSLRSLRLALASRRLPHSLADEKHVCSLARPGQRRASLAQRGGTRCATTKMRRKGRTVPYGRIGYASSSNSWYSATNCAR
jgi:hypothetical protein